MTPSRFISRLAALTLCLLAFLLAGTAGAQSLSVNKVRAGVHPDKTRLVLDLSAKPEFRVFTLESPVRLVIDMPEFSWQAGSIPQPPGSLIRDIRQGALQPGFARIVIDMERPIVIRSVFFLPKDGALPHRLVVDFSAADEPAMLAQKGRVFGNLRIEAEQPVAAAPARSADEEEPRTQPARSTTPPAHTLGQLRKPAPPARTAPETETAPVRPAPKPQISDSLESVAALPARKPERAAPATKPVIIIDAGHGGADPGAAGAGGLKEKNITLAIARALKKSLEETGRYRVKMTRDSDIYLRLHQRVETARKAKADLFVSIHADSIGRSGVQGASVYTLSDKASDAETEKLAMRENRADLIGGVDLSGEEEDVANILVDLSMRDTMNESRFFANTVVAALDSNGIRILDNPIRSAGFAVLKAPDVPSLLIETGFMSNANDSRLLATPAYQQKLARTLTASIDAYFERVQATGR